MNKKSLFLFALIIFCAFKTNAQTTLYLQTFNSGTCPEWTMNTTDLFSDNSCSDNEWVVNSSYNGGSIGSLYSWVINTPDEPSGVVDFPESFYMHILSFEATLTYSGPVTNANFHCDVNAYYFSAMNTPIVTTGYTGVTYSFWWTCWEFIGHTLAYGKTYYRTSATGSWMPLPGTLILKRIIHF
jgi:hypothetical protein